MTSCAKGGERGLQKNDVCQASFNLVAIMQHIYIVYIRGYSQIKSCIEQGSGGNQKVMFDDKGFRKNRFSDKGEGQTCQMYRASKALHG